MCATPKYTKKECTISSKKNTTSQTRSSILYLDDWTRYFRHRKTIKLSNGFRGYQCSLEKPPALSIELNSELQTRPVPF